jgi:hypothetical protein
LRKHPKTPCCPVCRPREYRRPVEYPSVTVPSSVGIDPASPGADSTGPIGRNLDNDCYSEGCIGSSCLLAVEDSSALSD